MKYFDRKTHTEVHSESSTTIQENDLRVVDFFKPLEDGYEVVIRDDLPFIERIVEPTVEELEELNKKLAIDALNVDRDEELKGFVLDDIYMNEDLIKTMFIEYSISTDNDTIFWININNSVVEFTKDDFLLLIKKGKDKVKEIYFNYRFLKDGVINGSN